MFIEGRYQYLTLKPLSPDTNDASLLSPSLTVLDSKFCCVVFDNAMTIKAILFYSILDQIVQTLYKEEVPLRSDVLLFFLLTLLLHYYVRSPEYRGSDAPPGFGDLQVVES